MALLLIFVGIFISLSVSNVNGFRLSAFKYDHFTYTQQWAQSVCSCADHTNHESYCKIPDRVTTWTVHGLWPTLGKSDDPQYCNHSWPFEESKILDIENKLKVYWAQLFVKNSRISFWEHEWEKHGTCCTDLASLNGEHKYFAKGLELNQKFNLTSMLKDAGITPSRTKSYKLSDVRSAVENVVGHKAYLHCCKANGKQRLQEIMICLDKDELKPTDCDRGDDECAEDTPTSYEPIVPSMV